jgi:phosphate:Na+ symporter
MSFLQVLGGLALFLFGVHMLSTGMEKLAGSQIQEWLDRLTGRPIKGALFGAAATGLLQSSSMMMITLFGLINANLMTLEQAIGVMLGQEIGTTLTAQIVAFDVGNFAFLFVALGLVLMESSSRRGWRECGEITMGFGLVFLGMDFMSGALKTLAEVPMVTDWLATMGQHPLAGVLAGTILTAIIQSSSAITCLAVAMGMSGTITLPGAIGLILGANIGTCIDTQMVAALRLSRPAFRASVAQVFINVFGVLLFLPFLHPFAALVSLTSASLPRQIANAHTIFNVGVSAILFPFVKQIARASRWLVPKSAGEDKPKLTAYIDEMQFSIPAVALTEAARELIRLGEVTAQMVESSRRALAENDIDSAQWVLEQEVSLVDPVHKLLEDFINTLMRRDLSLSQQKRCFQLKNLLTDIERVGDLAEDLAQAAQKRVTNGVPFSTQAMQDLDQLYRHAHHTYSLALQALQDGDRTMAQRACRLESEFDQLYWEARQGHIDRLNANVCRPEADVIFVEVLRNLERISDHADNLGVSVVRANAYLKSKEPALHALEIDA